MVISIFLGNQNSGKTLSMTYFCKLYKQKGYEIFSNYNLNFEHKKLTKDLIEEYTKSRQQFKKTVFAIDEIYLFFDSRSSASKSNKIFSYFVTQTSKNDVVLLGTAQYFNTVEKRFRDNVNNIIYCNRVLKTKYKGFKDIKQNKRFLPNKINDKLYIKMLLIRKYINGISESINKKTLFLKANRFYNLYNTKELINLTE